MLGSSLLASDDMSGSPVIAVVQVVCGFPLFSKINGFPVFTNIDGFPLFSMIVPGHVFGLMESLHPKAAPKCRHLGVFRVESQYQLCTTSSWRMPSWASSKLPGSHTPSFYACGLGGTWRFTLLQVGYLSHKSSEWQ